MCHTSKAVFVHLRICLCSSLQLQKEKELEVLQGRQAAKAMANQDYLTRRARTNQQVEQQRLELEALQREL